MTVFSTIHELLAKKPADAVAFIGSGFPSLTYGSLREHVERTVVSLNKLGIGRNDRVAIVLPNGTEMASAFVAIAAGTTSAPLNPGYRADEFEFYLSDLKAKALVVERGSTSPALSVTAKLNIPVIEIVRNNSDPTGVFELVPVESTKTAAAKSGGYAGTDDVALVLHTSGTTSRPKIVPLSQKNVCASAGHIRDILSLVPVDRGLSIMPLFHIHGLIGSVLSTLCAGGSVYCTPGFNALKFFAWMDEAKPTWYTAVPTMHQAILSRSANNREVIARHPLRFIRSSSSSLPPQVMAELEQVFNAPVLESYGMTEASHQMTSNPLPPRPHKPGTVGIAAGPEVAIMDESGKLLGSNATGEIVIRGANVTTGYENNPSANAENFTNGWFRTGDQGVIDAQGYLSITGRLKEIINRGGEKISPREVDEVLMDHPAVQQVVTFAMPHAKLGEDVAAAVVLREGKSADEKEIREFAAKRLADFKVPRKILILDEIPKGATGKLQRIGLAQKLGLG
ncbi:MAG: acyl--CoA ligase [Sulfuricaulis sp.]|nr:acyl--CoA ligase [Sulfuricaulis sp.]